MRLDHMTDDERISIHAPRKGERPASAYCVMCPPYFNPRSPQGGATFPPSFFTSAVAVFQSTLPARGSDFGAGGCLHGRPLFQSTLPARGSDIALQFAKGARVYFNPRSPQGGATLPACRRWGWRTISIHAPRKGERRDRRLFKPLPLLHFNPRSPQGGATAEKCICMQHFREFAEYYPLRHGDARCIAPQDCIIQAFFGAKKRCFYVRLCFALKNKGVRG